MLVQMDVRSAVSTMFRQIWKFMLVFIPITLIGFIYVLGAHRLYQSDATLLVKFGQDARPEVLLDARYQGGLSAEEKRGLVQSNLNILSSRDLAETLLREITIKKAYPKIDSLDISDEEKMTAAVKVFQKSVITGTESDAGVIRIGILNSDPAVANILLKNLVNLFLEKQSEVFGNPQLDVLREQAETSKMKLEKATQDLYEFKTRTGIASIDEELTLLLKQRSDIAGYMSRRTITSDEQNLDSGTSVSPSDYNVAQSNPDDLPIVPEQQRLKYEALPARLSNEGDTSRLPVIEDTQKKIDELKSKESQLLLTYKPTSHLVRNIRKNIEMETAALEEAVTALNDQIASLDSQIAQKQEFREGYDALSRQVALTTEAYNTAQSRLQAAEVNNDLNLRKITRISVIEEPTMPIKPSKPNRKLIMVLCVLLASALGAALGFGTELVDATFTRPEQLTAVTKKPVLSSFSNWYSKSFKPLPPSHEWKGRLESMVKTKTVPSVFEEKIVKPKILEEKDLLALYQSIISSLPDHGTRVVTISSSYEGEGCTTIASQLAHYAAQKLGQNVLFIGSELSFGLVDNRPPSFSILDAAQGRSSIKDAITHPHEQAPTMASAYLVQNDRYESIITNIDKIGQTLTELKKSFSLILIATPGIISKPAGLNIATVSDGVAFVVEAEKTRAPVVRQALNNIQDKGAKILGLILNKQIHYIPSWLYHRL